MCYRAKILADSIASGVRLTTLEVEHPRFILAEVNTHRVFSRNSASSRAIPVEKRIEQILADPFVPEAFGANKKGMQAGADLDENEQVAARVAWLQASGHAVDFARELAKLGVHKQWANRLLEPFAWHTAIISSTEWDNFFALRCNPEASPEFRKIAEMMRDAMAENEPEELPPGGWHLPLVTPFGGDPIGWLSDAQRPIEEQVKLSVARCARVSYLTHDGKRDVAADLALYDRLLTSGHMSPFEHAAKVVDKGVWPENLAPSNFSFPWLQHRKQLPHEAVFVPKT